MSSDSSRFVITGITGGAPNRLEINDFVKQEKQFSLYIQALQKIYSRDQSETLSFFQVAGIHGVPYTPWNGATGPKPFDPRRQWGGPYMLLYEQILYEAAQDIAKEYTVDTDAWIEAATNLRQPYWDWAQNSVPPPEVISLQQVPIITPDGKRTLVDNPLVRYRFHPVDSSFGRPYNQWPTTLRFPTNRTPSATSDVNRLRSVLRSAQPTIRTATFNMLTRVRTWPAFSSHTVGDGGSASNSLEAIHDSIHGYVGGGGHMSDPALAAFDPIFFLHHCNVDRLLSLWSAINPGVWVSTGDSEDGSFTMTAEEPVDGNTPLSPFWSTETDFWLSAGVTDTTKLGYCYPEFNGIDTGDVNAMQQIVLAIVVKLYGGQQLFGTSSSFQPTVNLAALSVATTSSEIQKPLAAEEPSQEMTTEHTTASEDQEPLAAEEPSQETTVEHTTASEIQKPLAADEPSQETTGEHATASDLAAEEPSKEVAGERAIDSEGQKPLAAEEPSEEATTSNATASLSGAVPALARTTQNAVASVEHDCSSDHSSLWEWAARIEFKKYELGCSFSVLLFLGDVSENPDEWLTAPNYIGAHFSFVNSEAGQCANCLDQIEIKNEGFIHLNNAIAEHSGLGSFDPEVVGPYLKKALKWRVQKLDGEPVMLPSLEVSIFGTPLTLPPGSMLPVPGRSHCYNGITFGRSGGCRRA